MPRRRPTARGVPERAFHRWLVRHLPGGRRGAAPLPLGDDAAAIAPSPGELLLVSTDALVEGTHFLRASPPLGVGAAAATVSLSDLAAKGARPAAVFLSLLVPERTPLAWARSVEIGAERLAARFGAHVMGGDTKRSDRRAIVSTVVGFAPAATIPPRSGARPGDLLVTTGTTGRGGAAWYAWRRDRRSRRAVARLLPSSPRVREGRALARWAHAMLDTSDGLAESAWLLAEASRVRVTLEADRLPWDPALGRLRPRARRRAAFFGGDYELLCALPARDVGRASEAVRRLGGRLTVVGRVEVGRGARWSVHGELSALPRAGWPPWERSSGRPP